MDQSKREIILKQMSDISRKVDEGLEPKTQARGKMAFYSDFEFKGSNLAVRNVHIVEIESQKQDESADIYQIYSEDGELIATVSADGKIHFAPEYLEQLKDIDERYFEQLNLENIDFELPRDLSEDDIVITKEELEQHKGIERARETKTKADDSKKEELKKEEEKKEAEAETEEEKKEKAAQVLDVKKDEIKSICSINPQEKITDKYNLIDIMPEAAEYREISIVYANGKFNIIGVGEDGNREQLSSIEPIEGTSTSKSVISVNEDGSTVTEKQVKGLFRINSRSRNDGISVSIGDYGMMDVDYVSNVMDRETRRATPIRTREAENQRRATSKVRENAGDSIGEMKKEGEIFREKQKEGIDPQSLDGIDIDEADGQGLTLEELKEQIKEKALAKGDMSRGEMQEFIRSEISESGLELSDDEIEEAVEDIREDIVDESRFPTMEHRK